MRTKEDSNAALNGDIRAIVFDAVGTLLYPRPSAVSVYASVGARFGSQLPAAEIARRFGLAFHRQEHIDEASGWKTSEEREHERWQHIVGEVLDDVSDPAACFAELFEHFSRPEHWRCDADAPSVLPCLAKEGYELGIASNFDRRLRSILDGMPACNTLDHVIISSEVGWRKPASEFFAAVCRACGLPASEVLFVGDDWRNDYEGARATGLGVILFDPHGKRPLAQPRIECLEELTLILPRRSPEP